jgi:predicted O-methyltransferase YrrM
MLTHQTESAATYNFVDDWFSYNIPQFEQFLGYLKGRPCGLLEIGSYEGRSAVWLVENIATHPASRIETIDVFENPRLQRNLEASGHLDKITFHRGASAVILRTLPLDSYDFAYIDGCHSTVNVLEDAVLAFGLVKAGGVIAFDDYLRDVLDPNQDGKPKKAIDAFLDIYSNNIELLYSAYQVWIRKRCEAPPTPYVREQ